MVTTDVLRIAVGVSALAFAGVADLRWRRAPDACWLIVAGAGLVLLGIDWLSEPGFWAAHRASLVTASIVLVLAVLGYVTGLIAGGADAKALASLAILAPLPLAGWSLPLASRLPLAVTALTNGLIVALAVPLVLLVINLLRGDLDGARTLLGFRTRLEHVDLRVVWPLEYIDDEGHHVVETTPGAVPRDAYDGEALARQDRDRIWVTPKVPFLVPLWVGLVTAVVLGDPFAWMLRAILT